MSIKHHFRPVHQEYAQPVPSPPPTPSDDDIDDAALLSLLPSSSTTLVSTSPVSTKTPCRKRKWSEAADLKVLQLAMLRQLAPQRKEVTWTAIANHVANSEGNQPSLSAGHTRSRFFTIMHDTARQHGVAYQLMSDRLALNSEPLTSHHVQHKLTEEPIENTHVDTQSKRTTAQILADAAFNAKLREVAYARIAHRPDLMAQQRAADALKTRQPKSSQPHSSQTTSQCSSSQPTISSQSHHVIPDSQGTIDERLAQVPIIHNPVPIQSSQHRRSQNASQMCHTSSQRSQSHPSSQPLPCAQPHSQSTSQLQSQSSKSSAANQLQHDLKSQLRNERLETEKQRVQHHTRNLQGQSAKRVYLGAIEHNARQNREKCYVFAREELAAANAVKVKQEKKRLKDVEKGRKKVKKERRWARMDQELRRKKREGGQVKKAPKVETITFVAGSEAEVRYRSLCQRVAEKGRGQDS